VGFFKSNINHNCIIYECNTSVCKKLKTNFNPIYYRRIYCYLYANEMTPLEICDA
jgi:uncharacterized protein YqkB